MGVLDKFLDAIKLNDDYDDDELLDDSILEEEDDYDVCEVCGWEYDEELGYPEGGIEPGTKWEDVPEDFTCPLCGVDKNQFVEE